MFSDPEISNTLKETHIDRSKLNNNFYDNFKINLENKLKDRINSSDLITSNNNITIEEVEAAINKPNNLSAPGPDRICTLLIKKGGEKLLNLIMNILNQTYNLGYYKKTTTLWPFFMDGVQLPQGLSHFEEAVYFLPFSSQKFLVLILSTSEG